MEARPTEEPPQVPFRVERSELTAQFNFASPYWPLAQNVAAIYAALLNRMSEFGVTSQGIRTDAGDGSLGAFNVNFWILQYAAIVRLRLDMVELHVPNFSVDPNQLERAYLALDQSLRDAHNATSYRNTDVTVAMHGRLDGIDSKQFLERFVGARPVGLGSAVGSGAVFYFENPSPLSLSSVTIDMSAVVAGGLFVKVQCVLDSSIPATAVRSLAEGHLQRSIEGLGLRVPDAS